SACTAPSIVRCTIPPAPSEHPLSSTPGSNERCIRTRMRASRRRKTCTTSSSACAFAHGCSVDTGDNEPPAAPGGRSLSTRLVGKESEQERNGAMGAGLRGQVRSIEEWLGGSQEVRVLLALRGRDESGKG